MLMTKVSDRNFKEIKTMVAFLFEAMVYVTAREEKLVPFKSLTQTKSLLSFDRIA